MKKTILSLIGLCVFPCIISSVFAAERSQRILLLIAEQNIESPQTAWWASEVDLSVVEQVLAQKFLEKGYQVVEPNTLRDFIVQKPAFRALELSENISLDMAHTASADYILLGKAVASGGAPVPHSSMGSYFGNISVKLIKVADGTMIGHFEGGGNSAHLDAVTGGKEALTRASEALAQKVFLALEKGGK